MLGVDEVLFRSDEEKHWAAVSQLLLIGEAANRLSEAFRGNHPRVPWREIVAMRNRLIHEYDKINWRLVWKTASEDVPFLLAELQGLVSEDTSQELDTNRNPK